MKASELIKALQLAVKESGDFECHMGLAEEDPGFRPVYGVLSPIEGDTEPAFLICDEESFNLMQDEG